MRYYTKPMSSSRTAQEVANITDEGRFEELATAVLRQAEPLYRSLCHVGVTAAGQTRKSPSDGICPAPGADPPRMIVAHHTITEGKGLRKKWLHDPSTVRPRKGSRPVAPPGDLIKTSRIVEEKRKRSPTLRVTLVLTSKGEPTEDLVWDVTATGNALGIDVDIWSRSRLCDFLDHDPRGQWLRHEFLGIEQEQLSVELLRELSERSLDVYAQALHDAPSIWVDRGLDRLLEARSLCKLTLLVGGSGSGKSVACYRRLRAHVDAGGVGLVVRHEDVVLERSLETAVTASLCQLHPALARLGPTAFSLCSPDSPLLLVVEDINHSGQPRALAERVASWARGKDDQNGGTLPPWRILCPAWPEALAAVQDQTRRELEAVALSTPGFTPSEGRDAVVKRARAASRTISPLRAGEISEALGHDPLLIALHDPDKTVAVHQIIAEFVDGALARAAASDSAMTVADGREALRTLAGEILRTRQIDPDWRTVRSWTWPQGDQLRTIAALAKQGEILRLTGPSDEQLLSFRHDRVRDWLLADAIVDLEARGLLTQGVAEDPYFAEVIGTALALAPPASGLVVRVAESNPLALFHALRILSPIGPLACARISAAVHAWLDSPKSQDLRSNAHLRAEALNILCQSESPDVKEFVHKLGVHGYWADLALLRNGDLAGGIRVCLLDGPGCESSLRDLQIEHARLRYGDNLIAALGAVLSNPQTDEQSRAGALTLAGHIADPRLAPPIGACWDMDTQRLSRLGEYLWAAAECCASDPGRQLGPVCDAWAGLPSEEDIPGMGSPRARLGSSNINLAFRRQPPTRAVEYFVLRAADESLKGPITSMLTGVDNPVAVEFLAHRLAEIARRLDGTKLPSLLLHTAVDGCRRAQEQGRPMSAPSRSLLQGLWQDASRDRYLRNQAFSLWAATRAPDDITLLRTVDGVDDLADAILWERLQRNDRDALPALLAKLRSDENWNWWNCARHLWSDELTGVLDEFLARRAAKTACTWGEAIDPDYIASELVMCLPDREAEQLLQRHWGSLRFSGPFAQAALYVGTPLLLKAVETTVCECPSPAVLFRHITLHYGERVHDRPGLIRDKQVLDLERYLDFLEQFDIRQLWDACNRHGWFDIRRRLLDHRLDSPFLPPGREEENIAASLDELIAKEHSFLLRHWLDHLLDSGVAWNDLLGWMAAWLNQRRSLKALNIVATAIMLHGKRSDLEVLDVCNSMPEEAAKKLVVDVRFAVRRSRPH